LVYFVVFLFINLCLLPMGYIYMYFRVLKGAKGQLLLKLAFLVLFGLAVMVIYYFYDIYNFWYHTYKQQHTLEDLKDESKIHIEKVKVLFSKLLPTIADKVNKKENKRKAFPITELISSWVMKSHGISKDESETNIAHKKSLLAKKYKDLSTMRKSHLTLYSKSEHKVSYLLHYGFIINFLNKFGDRTGEIDRDLAVNLFPKRSYYDDEYFEYIYYFQDKIFRRLISELTYKGNEKKKELSQLQRVQQDLNRIVDKFKDAKYSLATMNNNNISVLNTGISLVNKIFAILENNLLDLQANQLFSQIGKMQGGAGDGAAGPTATQLGAVTMFSKQ